jgi:hypothetical protein
MSAAPSIESISTDICLHVFVQNCVVEEQITQLLELSNYKKTEKEVILREMPYCGRLSFCKINLCDEGILKGFSFLGDCSNVFWFSASLPVLSATNGREHLGEFPVGLSYTCILLSTSLAVFTRP